MPINYPDYQNSPVKISYSEALYKIKDTPTGWHKIEIDDGEEGWITSRYAELFD